MKQRSSFSRRFISLVVGLIFIQGGYVIFAGSRIPSYMAFVIGSFFILNAIFDWLVPPRNAWLDIVATHAVFASGPLWVAVNVMLILICAITGYANRAAVELGGTLRLTLLCVALFVMIPATVVTTLYFSKCSHFRNPTWKEFPFRLNEPLQNLFLATWWAFGIFIGAFLRAVESGLADFRAAAIWFSVFIGFLVARVLSYKVYSQRIIDRTG